MPTLSARRRDRQAGEQDALRLIAEAEFGHLATVTDDGYPYVIPVNHALDGKRILIHCATEGQKLANIERDPRVCYEVSQMIDLVKGDVPCRYSAKYQSAVAFGKATVVRESEAKRRALGIIAKKFTGMEGPFDDAELTRVSVIEIEIEGASAKIRT